MRRLARAASLCFGLAFGVAASPGVALAAGPTFDQPAATATLGQPLTFNSTITGAAADAEVEVLVRLAGHDTTIVIPAQAGAASGSYEAAAEIDLPSSVECSCFFDGQSAPNSRVEFQFRVRATDGTVSLGPVGNATVTDDRFEWRTLEEDQVRVHWYEGDEAFARSALNVANDAIDNASDLLGATLDAPVDLFVYATEDAMREAISPNRENVAGQAHQTIQTMFVHIPPDQGADAFAGVLVAHELTHLVFDEATENPFHGPPRWLNEGTAVYLSEGYAPQWQAPVNAAASTNTLIPLQGLAGFFPSPEDQFYLAYGESVSAVDYFVRTYSDQVLWDLVRSYSQGLSDDDAFRAATGGDLAAFNAAWTASLGTSVRDPVGPQPAPPGPVPSAWQVEQQPSPPPSAAVSSPGATVTPSEATGSPRTTAPARTASPGVPLPTDSTGGSSLIVVVVGVAAVLLVILLIGLVVARRRTQPPPPPPRWF